MKKITVIIAGLIIAIMSACSQDDQLKPISSGLAQSEIDDLLFLYEEEKMARDLYLYALEQYGTNQFNNISASEQRHMDAVSTLLDKYAIDFTSDHPRGVFTNQDLQALYESLFEQMQMGLSDALIAAALVEETDIMDIRRLRGQTEKSDVIQVYDALECASGNHIRAYTSKYAMLGFTYLPSVMTQVEYDEVIQQNHQSCGL